MHLSRPTEFYNTRSKPEWTNLKKIILEMGESQDRMQTMTEEPTTLQRSEATLLNEMVGGWGSSWPK